MKLLSTVAAVSIYQALAFALPAESPVEKRATVQGFDISHYQSNVNFQGAYNSGARFVIIKVLIRSTPSFPPVTNINLRPPKAPPTSTPASPRTTTAPPPPA